MKNYTITVNGTAYEVTVEETGSVSAPAAAPVAAPKAAPAAAPKAAAPAGAGHAPSATSFPTAAHRARPPDRCSKSPYRRTCCSAGQDPSHVPSHGAAPYTVRAPCQRYCGKTA